MIMQNLVVIFFLLFASEMSLAQQSYTATAIEEKAPSKVFRASLVKVDITPKQPQWLLGYGPIKLTGVHDKIYEHIVLNGKARRSTTMLTM